MARPLEPGANVGLRCRVHRLQKLKQFMELGNRQFPFASVAGVAHAFQILKAQLAAARDRSLVIQLQREDVDGGPAVGTGLRTQAYLPCHEAAHIVSVKRQIPTGPLHLPSALAAFPDARLEAVAHVVVEAIAAVVEVFAG